MNFAAGTAGAGVAHGPEIVFQAGNRDHAIRGDLLLEPKSARFFVDTESCARRDFGSAEDRDVELVFRNPEPIGRSDKLPRKGDRRPS